MDRYQILEDLRKWLGEQHEKHTGTSIEDSGYPCKLPDDQCSAQWHRVHITAWSTTLDKIEELENEHE